MTLPPIFALYNPKSYTFLSPVPTIPWVNCGMGSDVSSADQPLRLPDRMPDSPWVMADREDPWSKKMDRALWWSLIAARSTPGQKLISYDPFSFDPWSLTTLGVGTYHMWTRRKLCPYLMDYDAWATDVYLPGGYDWPKYQRWALAKCNAIVRVCAENGKVPVVLLNLDGDLDRQARLARLADKRIRWGLWQDPASEEDARRHQGRLWELETMMGGRAAE